MGRKPRIRIRQIFTELENELRNIAENKGIPFQLFLKQKLTEIANNYPEPMKKNFANKTDTKTEELNISGASEKTTMELTNICNSLGCEMSTFLKIELKKISEGYPDRFKNKPLDY